MSTTSRPFPFHDEMFPSSDSPRTPASLTTMTMGAVEKDEVARIAVWREAWKDARVGGWRMLGRSSRRTIRREGCAWD